LNLNNPNQIVDPVFALLGDAAAAAGAGKITVGLHCSAYRHLILTLGYSHLEP
jgi:hypothetical protein